MKKRNNPKIDAMRERSLIVESERQNLHTPKYFLNEQEDSVYTINKMKSTEKDKELEVFVNKIDNIARKITNMDTPIDSGVIENLKSEVIGVMNEMYKFLGITPPKVNADGTFKSTDIDWVKLMKSLGAPDDYDGSSSAGISHPRFTHVYKEIKTILDQLKNLSGGLNEQEDSGIINGQMNYGDYGFKVDGYRVEGDDLIVFLNPDTDVTNDLYKQHDWHLLKRKLGDKRMLVKLKYNLKTDKVEWDFSAIPLESIVSHMKEQIGNQLNSLDLTSNSVDPKLKDLINSKK